MASLPIQKRFIIHPSIHPCVLVIQIARSHVKARCKRLHYALWSECYSIGQRACIWGNMLSKVVPLPSHVLLGNPCIPRPNGIDYPSSVFRGLLLGLFPVGCAWNTYPGPCPGGILIRCLNHLSSFECEGAEIPLRAPDVRASHFVLKSDSWHARIHLFWQLVSAISFFQSQPSDHILGLEHALTGRGYVRVALHFMWPNGKALRESSLPAFTVPGLMFFTLNLYPYFGCFLGF